MDLVIGALVIHNTTYRGIVIGGLIHNDDPSADAMWRPTGSYWTQPAGQPHINSAKGSHNLAYIEIEEGPYLVLPLSESFESREQPVNVDATNMVWLDASSTAWVGRNASPTASAGPLLAFLRGHPGDDGPNGTLVKLSNRSKSRLHVRGGTFRAIFVRGTPAYQRPDAATAQTLPPGSYFSSVGDAVHVLSCLGEVDCTLYVRLEGRYDVAPE